MLWGIPSTRPCHDREMRWDLLPQHPFDVSGGGVSRTVFSISSQTPCKTKARQLSCTGTSCGCKQECWDELGTVRHLSHHPKPLLWYWVDRAGSPLAPSFALQPVGLETSSLFGGDLAVLVNSWTRAA